MNAEPMIPTVSIDAWRDADGGWTWNQRFKREPVPAAWLDLSKRELLRRLRDAGCYSLPCPGLAAVEDDGYNLVVTMRGTGEPVLALEYGSLQP